METLITRHGQESVCSPSTVQSKLKNFEVKYKEYGTEIG